MNKLKKLITGIDTEATMALNDVWNTMPHSPSIAWYPIAAYCLLLFLIDY